MKNAATTYEIKSKRDDDRVIQNCPFRRAVLIQVIST